MWHLKDKTNDHRGKKEKKTKKQTVNYGEETDG